MRSHYSGRRAGNHFVYAGYLVQRKEQRASNRRTGSSADAAGRTPEAATEGSIRVYDYDGCCIYSYYGKIRINSDGKDGKEIDVEALGYLEGYQEHKEESGAGE